MGMEGALGPLLDADSPLGAEWFLAMYADEQEARGRHAMYVARRRMSIAQAGA
jgi:hypothetical protein